MATRLSAYGARTAIVLTLTSLANTTGARQSTVVDNTVNKYLDVEIRVQTNGSAAGNNATLDFYVYSALGDTTYTDGCTGTDGTFTVANRKNAKYLDSITLNGTTAVVGTLRGVAQAFGGVMPDKWGLIAINNSGAALAAAAGTIEYEGLSETVA